MWLQYVHGVLPFGDFNPGCCRSRLLGGHACNMCFKGHCLVTVAVVLVQSVETAYTIHLVAQPM
jgi:hypothetical protein